MPDNPHAALAFYRLEKAEDCYLAAQKLLESGLLRDSANRSYYAIFHAVRAVLALDQVDFKKHSAVISYFQQYYIIHDKKRSESLLAGWQATSGRLMFTSNSFFAHIFVFTQEASGVGILWVIIRSKAKTRGIFPPGVTFHRYADSVYLSTNLDA